MTVPSQRLIPVQYDYPQVPVVEIAQAYVHSQQSYTQGPFEPQSSGQSSLGLSSVASPSSYSTLSPIPYPSTATSPDSAASLRATPDAEYVMVTDGVGLPRARRVSPSGTSPYASPGHGIRALSNTPPEMRPQQGSYDGRGNKGKGRA